MRLQSRAILRYATVMRNPLRYHLVNVFCVAGQSISGNALAVFEPSEPLGTDLQQALALQMNLSETTFISGVTAGRAHVRIFTPSYEMPFAGHPSLGTAEVLRRLGHCASDIVLQVPAGAVPLRRDQDIWTLQRPFGSVRPAGLDAAVLAAALGLGAPDLAGEAVWVDTGACQLLLPLATAGALDRLAPQYAQLLGLMPPGQALQIYLFHDDGQKVSARFLFDDGFALREDPATGSACANLGAWLHAQAPRGAQRRISQGAQVRRPSELHLGIVPGRGIEVGGRVTYLGSGEIALP